MDTRHERKDAVLLGVEYGDVGAALDSLSPEFRAVIQATVLDGMVVIDHCCPAPEE